MPKKDGTQTAQERREWEEGQHGKELLASHYRAMMLLRIRNMTMDEVIDAWFNAQKEVDYD